MNIYGFELKRSFRTPGFYLSLLIGCIIAIADWINYGLQYALHQDDWMNGCIGYAMLYPNNVYESWIGASDSKYAAFFFLILPLLVVLPFASSFYKDNKNNFISYICTRVRKRDYLRAKFVATFISGGLVIVLPLILNFILCASVLPCILPQPADGMCQVEPKTSLSSLYFLHPEVFCIISVALIFIFAGVLAVTALYVAFYVKRIYSVLLYPFVLSLVIMSGADLLEAYVWQPLNVVNPVYDGPRMFPLMIEIAILLVIALWEFLYRGRKQDILS